MLNTIIETIYGRVSRHRQHLGLLVIVLPMLLLSVYYVLIATDRYISESKVIVKQSSEVSGQLTGVSLPFLGAMGGGSNEDAMYLKEFIQSPDMLDQLDKQLNLRNEYSATSLDVFNMLPPWATKEDFLQLYRKRVAVAFEEKSGVLSISAQGVSPELAQKLNQTILREAEKFVNELSQKVAREQVDFAAEELQRSRKSLDEARENLLGYQNKNAILDPSVSAEMTNRVIADLQSQLSGKEVELKSLSAMLQDGTAQVTAVRQAIAGIKRQLEFEQKKLTSLESSALNRTAAKYLDYKAMVDFQSDVYKIALAAFEKTRFEAARKAKSVAVLSSPQLAERAEYPQRTYMLAAWLFGLCLLFGLIKLTIEIIEDHRD